MTSITFNQTLSVGKFTIGGTPQVITSGNGILCFEKDIPPNTTDFPIVFPALVDPMKACAIEVTGVEVIVSTNDVHGGSPTDNFSVYPGFPFGWTEKMPTAARFFTGNIDNIFITNSDGAKTAHIKILVSLDLFTD